MKKFTLGADPELFLQDAAESLVSVIEKIGGTKEMPLPLPIGTGFAVQEDNVAVEFNIPPSSTEDELDSNLDKAMTFLQNFFTAQHGLRFSRLSAASFPKEQLTHPKALVFGCDPDFNAWTRRENPRPEADDPQLRSAGGHIHVGFEAADDDEKFNLIKCMDTFLGVPSVFMDEGELRRKLYGKRGACRLKPYGVEYRTLSNFWVMKPELRKWVWRQTQRAMEALPNISEIEEDDDYIFAAINHNDKSVADYLVTKYNLEILYA